MNESETRAEYINLSRGNKNPTLYDEYVESISTITKLAKALNVSTNELLK